MMAMDIVNVVDAGALAHLAQSDNLDLLTAAGRKVVVTVEVLNEVVGHDPTRPNAIKVRQWYDAQIAAGNLSNGYREIADTDKDRYNPPEPNGDVKAGQEGDVSIKKFIDESSNSGKLYNIISNDGDLINFTGDVPGYQYRLSGISAHGTV